MKSELLIYFRNKAGCSYTQHQAEKIWSFLVPYLTRIERDTLSIAWSHFNTGEGADELYDKINKIVKSNEK